MFELVEGNKQFKIHSYRDNFFDKMPRPSSNQTFHGGVNVAFINVTYNIFQIQHKPISPNTFLTFLIPVVLNFLELQYQGKTFSPFQEYPKTMRVALVSLLLYCFAYDFEMRLRSSHPTPAHAQVVHGGMVVFGWLLSISLASVLCQDSVWLALYVLIILFSNREILNCRIKAMYNWLQRRMSRGNLLPL